VVAPWKDPRLVIAVLAGATLLASQVVTWVGSDVTASAVLTWTSLGLGSVYGGHAAWTSVRNFRLDIDVLMIVGAGLAAWIGHPGEGALLLFMFTLAGALEHRALAKAKDAVSRLTKLMPSRAMVKDSTTGQWVARAAESLVPGDMVLVRPGETVPADCVVTSGQSEVDTSTLTGESLPRAVVVGDGVFAGTVNQSGSIEAKVTRGVGESSLKRVLAMVIEAQERKPPAQRLIDRLSTPYTITVFALAIAALLWLRFGAEQPWAAAIYRAITFLIVASPCALVIATPTVTLCGLSRAARSGLLIKGGDALERLAGVRTVALDKTGTLTLGHITVTSARAFGGDEHTLAGLAAAVETHSTHPLAQAVVKWAECTNIALGEVSDVRNVPGMGLEAVAAGGERVRIGRFEWACDRLPDALRKQAKAAVDEARAGGALIAVSATEHAALVLSLADQPRPGAAALVARLRDAGIHRVAMLTGDHRVIAEKVANEVGIEVVYAELLPEQKVERLRELKTLEGAGSLAIVGDGVNDAPALAVADVGLAMGGIGAGAALEAADVVVMNDDLSRIPWAFALAHRVRSTMIANLTIAVGVILVLGTLALLGVVPLGLGVVGHEGSTLVVVGVSLTVLGFRGPRALS
jgi:Cd2+/Zn2+-exporting ATPase